MLLAFPSEIVDNHALKAPAHEECLSKTHCILEDEVSGNIYA